MYSSKIVKIKLKPSVYRQVSFQAGNEYTKVPKYPEILDISEKANANREKLAKHKRIEALNTVEEKLFALNMDKYYGWKSLILKEGEYPYNFLPLVKHITRTHVKEVDSVGFHKAQRLNLEESQELLDRVRPHLQDALLFELKGRRNDPEVERMNSKNFKSEKCISLVHKINNVLLTYFSNHFPHLMESMVDYEPRQEAFWCVGGFHPNDEEYNKRKENKKLSEKDINEKVEHWIQYLGNPVIQVRHTFPLDTLDTNAISSEQEEVSLNAAFSECYDPTLTYGLELGRRHGTNIPGFWPGDKNEFGLMSYHATEHLAQRPSHFGEHDQQNTLHSQAILASFSWLLSQASYQGFSTFSELTYPLVNQCILTDGRVFAFYLYQLNTTLLHSLFIESNPRSNVCFALKPAPLYQEIKGSEFIGWNDDTLRALISMYLCRPVERKGVEMKPYLGKEEQILAHIQDEDRRDWLHAQFRHMYSNRPRHKLGYEIYDWERIYKIKFQTRPLEARIRPFERDEDPLEERKYYEHMRKYIPKSQRPKKKHWTGWRAKFAKTYYPEI
ncbi:unnamed protein product [Nezara viridula]|uniref:28S ribosomal protein S30, mitochondrial n=1 Tax=Nezara viridula TaxID=85310 RepID=A0A9P0HT48_NEZVI|nr:unnamed protein product [Nezara viridula]